MVDSVLLAALTARRVLTLDGALATELERHGADLSGDLWSARLLLDQPELIARVHRDYFEAGADVAITASYQASLAGFTRRGMTEGQARVLIQSSVGVAVAVRDHFWMTRTPRAGDERVRPVVAASVGPYGAVLADGSEYRGHYAISHRELVRFHQQRLEVLAGAGAELLACETIPSKDEAVALVEALAGWPELAAWMSFSARNDTEVSDGTSIADCASFLHDQPQIVAVGVNCTAVPHVGPLLRALAEHTDKPLVAYPNSGETYDSERHSWTGPRAPVDFGALTHDWYAAGARIIGGCCRTGPADIREVSAAAREINNAWRRAACGG